MAAAVTDQERRPLLRTDHADVRECPVRESENFLRRVPEVSEKNKAISLVPSRATARVPPADMLPRGLSVLMARMC